MEFRGGAHRRETGVVPLPHELELPRAAGVEPPAPPPALGEPADVTESIEPVNDPGSYDAESGVAELWIRLRNVSATPLAGPIEVETRRHP